MLLSILITFAVVLPQILSLDTVDITGAAECGLTTKFLRNQLAPFLAEFRDVPRNLRITYHALSDGSRHVNGSVIPKTFKRRLHEVHVKLDLIRVPREQSNATCNNGWLECELSKLQTCSKRYIHSSKNSTELLSVVICMQGQRSVENAMSCLPKGNVGRLIQRCATSQEGEKLFLAEPFPYNQDIWFPFIKINGQPSHDAKRYFKKVICELASARNEGTCRRK